MYHLLQPTNPSPTRRFVGDNPRGPNPDTHPNPKMQTSTKALVNEGLVVGFGNVALGSDGDASGAVLG